MRLIDADALKEAMNYNGACGICFRYVDDADTIDAEPVRRGRWLRLDEAPEWDQRRCSECGDISCCQRNYCPNCGSKMDGDKNAAD